MKINNVDELAEAALQGKLPQLQALALSGTAITDAGLQAFAEAARVLDFSNTGITDAGLRALAEAALQGKLPQLLEHLSKPL